MNMNMNMSNIKAKIASELISVSNETLGKKPTHLNLEELIDVVEKVFNNINSTESESEENLSENCEHFQHDHCDCIGKYCRAGR